MNSALIVIDFQNAVLSEPPAWQADTMLERIAGLIARARAADVPVIYVQHNTANSADLAGSSWAAGTHGWQFPALIAPQPQDHVSAKSSCDAFRQTGLQQHLAQAGITTIYVCGYATEFCIDTSVRRAASLELATVVISDAHTTRDRPHLAAPAIVEHHNWVWGQLLNPGNPVTLVTADAVTF